MSTRKREPKFVTVHTISPEDSILPVGLHWRPPYAELSTNPGGFSRFWQFAEYAFHLPSPYEFPAFGSDLGQDDVQVIERFIVTCEELAQYTLMSASDSLEFETAGGETTMKANFSSIETLRAFLVLFRQLYAKDENASFHKTISILSRLNAVNQDSNSWERNEILRRWRRAHGALLQRRMSVIVARIAVDTHAGGRSGMVLPFEDVRPTEVISRWAYGDLIHWGDKRGAMLASRDQGGPLPDFDRYNFQESMIGLAHLYLGFSVIAARAFDIPHLA